MNTSTYYPTESVDLTVTVSVRGTLTNWASGSVTVQDAAGNQTVYSTPTNTGTGAYLQTVQIPATPALGRWSYWWNSVGSQPNQYGVSSPGYFYVVATGQP